MQTNQPIPDMVPVSNHQHCMSTLKQWNLECSIVHPPLYYSFPSLIPMMVLFCLREYHPDQSLTQNQSVLDAWNHPPPPAARSPFGLMLRPNGHHSNNCTSNQPLLEDHTQASCQVPVNMAVHDPSSGVVCHKTHHQETIGGNCDGISDDMWAEWRPAFVVTSIWKSSGHHPEPVAMEVELHSRRRSAHHG